MSRKNGEVHGQHESEHKTGWWNNRFILPFIAVCFCFTVSFLLNGFASLFESWIRINPFEAKIGDVELSDAIFAFSHRTRKQDPNVVIVDCLNDSYTEIAEKIGRLEKMGAQVIGIDITFTQDSDKAGIDTLATILSNIKKGRDNVILERDFDKEDDATSIKHQLYYSLNSKNKYQGHVKYGFVTFEEQAKTLRTFEPCFVANGNKVDTSFEVMVVKAKLGIKDFSELEREKEKWSIINYHKFAYKGERYVVSDAGYEDSLKLKGKVVLLGKYDSGRIVDRHFTPLNEDVFGRSLPDMDGVEYHAQIISMLLNKDFLTEIPSKKLFILLISYLAMLYFFRLHRKHPHYFHYAVDLGLFAAVLLSIVISFGFMEIHRFRIKIEPLDFLVPVSQCGFFLHLFFGVKECIEKKLSTIKTSKNGKNRS